MDTQRQQETIGRRSIFATSLSFFILSFLGWAYETFLCFALYGRFSDRGFLRLPFCPIYGGVVCALYLLVGTPAEGGFARGVRRLTERFGWRAGVERALRYVGYFLLSVLFATVTELVVGLLFQSAGHILWSYAAEPYNFRGVICPSVSICWGFLLTVVMRYPYTWLLRGIELAPKRAVLAQSVLLGVALSVDFLLCLARL